MEAKKGGIKCVWACVCACVCSKATCMLGWGVQMPCVNKVIEPHDKQMELTTLLSERKHPNLTEHKRRTNYFLLFLCLYIVIYPGKVFIILNLFVCVCVCVYTPSTISEKKWF